MPSNYNVYALFVELLCTLLLMGYRPTDFEPERYTQMQNRRGNTHLKIQVKADLTEKLQYAFYPLCHGNHQKASACRFPVITKT